MNFSVGETLRVDGDIYEVIGKVVYRNLEDGCMWVEYRLYSNSMRKEKWLSCDDTYHEYSISEVCRGVSTSGYHQVDGGVEEVVEAHGDVDVEVGERATFTEFEDITEERIVSWEKWDDGMEQSTGYYLDDYEIQRVGNNGGNAYGGGNNYASRYSNTDSKKASKFAAVVMLLVVFLPGLFSTLSSSFSLGSPKISEYLADSNMYTYVTSITGLSSEKADVYESSYSIDLTAKDIIDAIEGDTSYVQQNQEDEDDSVAILTDKEYCLIYSSEDNKTLVQISNRKYAYANDNDPYRSRRGTRRYYRRFYYSRGYYSDRNDYSSTYSPYSSYSDETLNYSSGDVYNSYSYNVRQSSVSSRRFSGGGTSSGK